jgi:hypothetical protein
MLEFGFVRLDSKIVDDIWDRELQWGG